MKKDPSMLFVISVLVNRIVKLKRKWSWLRNFLLPLKAWKKIFFLQLKQNCLKRKMPLKIIWSSVLHHWCNCRTDHLKRPTMTHFFKGNHYKIVWLGRELCLVQSPCKEQGHVQWDQVPQRPIQPGLECFQGKASTTSLGNQLLCFTTLIVITFFLISNLNWSSFSLKPLPLVPSQQALLNLTS